MELMIFYLVIINIISFTMYGIDKVKARFNKWRIPENTLLVVSFIGGSLGSILGMEIFRHKTKHLKFKILNPLFLILHIISFILIMYKF